MKRPYATLTEIFEIARKWAVRQGETNRRT